MTAVFGGHDGGTTRFVFYLIRPPWLLRGFGMERKYTPNAQHLFLNFITSTY